ncbi:MAG TPA: radical SAM protein [Phycisphaerae bacterium]|nr:radical SAM protein [Phycisphaerales bacterium]HRX87069.1 radical SAM protein [Phycisphaerae bacterium]
MTTAINLPVVTSPGAAPANLASPDSKGAQIELAQIYNFASKLRQPQAQAALRAYVGWQTARRAGQPATPAFDPNLIPDLAPLSINLDLTTACNYACDHCIDMDILNTGTRFEHEKLLASLKSMAQRGLKSVIVIGGGEPTLYPYFADTVRYMKSLGLQVAIVSNGTGNQKIADMCACLDEHDWVRLSLDSGTDATFQKMHKPKKAVTLEQICGLVPLIKERNPKLTVGFSYIVTWRGATVNGRDIVENLHEIAQAARLARDSRFSYIGFKPFLSRAEANNAEVIGVDRARAHLDQIIAQIRAQIDAAKRLATPEFRVSETTGMKAFCSRKFEQFGQQPQQCHMQFFRQVLSPLGMYNCPVYRNQPHGRLGDKNAYADLDAFTATRRAVAERIDNFNATTTCAEVTCLYNDANWWIEDLIAHPEQLDLLEADTLCTPDYFL